MKKKKVTILKKKAWDLTRGYVFGKGDKADVDETSFASLFITLV